jgi:hypothetical protein
MKRTHQVPVLNVSGGGGSSETKCEVDVGHHPIPALPASAPHSEDSSPLVTTTLKRVVLPNTHVTTLTPLSSPSKQQQISGSANIDASTPLSIAQATYAAAGHGHISIHGHSQSKKFASLPVHSPTVADRLADKLTSPLRPSTSSGVSTTAPIGRGKQQTVIQNAGAALTSYSDHYSDLSSCDYMDEQQRRAARAELVSTQAFEAIQKRMLSGDYSLLEETVVVPGNTPRRGEEVFSPRGHASNSQHRSAVLRGPSTTSATVHKLSTSRGSTKHSGSGFATTRGVTSAVVSSTAIHIKTTSIAHQATAPLRFG